MFDFGSVPTVWYFLFDFGSVPTVWHFLFDFGSVPTVWYFLFDVGTVPTVWYFLFDVGTVSTVWYFVFVIILVHSYTDIVSYYYTYVMLICNLSDGATLMRFDYIEDIIFIVINNYIMLYNKFQKAF